MTEHRLEAQFGDDVVVEVDNGSVCLHIEESPCSGMSAYFDLQQALDLVHALQAAISFLLAEELRSDRA